MSSTTFLVSYAQIQKQFELGSLHTAKKYIHYLQEACLFRLLPLYTFKSGEKQSLRKCYAIDPAFITNHEDFLQTPNLGWILENVVAVELMRKMNSEIEQLFYLRKHKSFEVDFVHTELRTYPKGYIYRFVLCPQSVKSSRRMQEAT